MTSKELAAKNKSLCAGCTKCCEHVAIEIDKPEDGEDFRTIMWYVMHKNVYVFVDEDDEWYVEFRTTCESLQDNGLCGIYDIRPDICRDYDQSDCERTGTPYVSCFRSKEDVINYVKKNTDIDLFNFDKK